MEILTSLLIYKNTLYAGYLDGTIKTVLKNKNSNLWGNRTEFKCRLRSSPLILKGYRNNIFALTDQNIQFFDLEKSDEISVLANSELTDSFDLDINQRLLFLASQGKGVVAYGLNSNFPNKPKFLLSFSNELKYYFSNDVTNILSFNGSIFYTERDKGIKRLYYKKYNDTFSVDNAIDKLELKFVLDLKYNEKNNSLYIFDRARGFIIFNCSNGEITFESRDVLDLRGRNIFFDGQNAILITDVGIYYFDFLLKAFHLIALVKAGNVTKYYDTICFSSKSRIFNLVVTSDKSFHRNVSSDQETQALIYNRKTKNVTLI